MNTLFDSGIYIRQNNRNQMFELIQEEDGFVYDRKFHTERQAIKYLEDMMKLIRSVTNKNIK